MTRLSGRQNKNGAVPHLGVLGNMVVANNFQSFAIANDNWDARGVTTRALEPELKLQAPASTGFSLRREANFLTSRHVSMKKVIFYVWNTLKKLMIRVCCLGKCVG